MALEKRIGNIVIPCTSLETENGKEGLWTTLYGVNKRDLLDGCEPEDVIEYFGAERIEQELKKHKEAKDGQRTT